MYNWIERRGTIGKNEIEIMKNEIERKKGKENFDDTRMGYVVLTLSLSLSSFFVLLFQPHSTDSDGQRN